MKLDIQQCGAVSVVKPSGPLTADDTESFTEEVNVLVKSTLGRVVFDVSAVPYVDSRGLESLVEIADELAASGQALKLCAANDTLTEVLSLTGLDVRFEQFEDSHTAVRSFL